MKLSDQEIYKKIEEIYNNEKGQPFITHLIRSFTPIHRSTFMLENEKKKIMKCAITNIPLISKGELIAFQFENHEEIFKNMADRLLGNKTENIVIDNFKGKMLAVECEKSVKVLSLPAVQQLLNFASSELLNGNKHISYVINDERKKEKENKTNRSAKYAAKYSNKPISKPKKEVVVHSTTNLSDLSVLQNLKKQLEDAGK